MANIQKVQRVRVVAVDYTKMASEMFNVRPLDVTPEQRNAAKTFYMGKIYGMGPDMLESLIGKRGVIKVKDGKVVEFKIER